MPSSTFWSCGASPSVCRITLESPWVAPASRLATPDTGLGQMPQGNQRLATRTGLARGPTEVRRAATAFAVAAGARAPAPPSASAPFRPTPPRRSRHLRASRSDAQSSNRDSHRATTTAFVRGAPSDTTATSTGVDDRRPARSAETTADTPNTAASSRTSPTSIAAAHHAVCGAAATTTPPTHRRPTRRRPRHAAQTQLVAVTSRDSRGTNSCPSAPTQPRPQ